MTSSENPKPSALPPNEPQHPNKKGAKRIKRYRPLSLLIKLTLLLLALLLLTLIAFYIMAGTSQGTRFLVEKVISETGVKIVYTEGNLREGLLLEDVMLSASKDIDVHLIDAYVKVGWRAIFQKEVHLREATIGRIEVVNRKPVTGDPFDYKALDLPINLRFDHAKIDAIEYDQVGETPIIFTDVIANELSWVGTKVVVGDAVLQYGDIVNVADLTGFVDLQGSYPLAIDAIATVSDMDDLYIDPLQISAKGSVRLTTGTVKGKYNNKQVHGNFTVQSLANGTPFDAKLMWDEIDIPYAEEQDIKLQQGLLIASGVLSKIEMRISTDLSAKDLPTGHYQSRAIVADEKLQIGHLVALTDEGLITGTGTMNLGVDFSLQGAVKSDNYDIRALLPKEFAPYAPEKINGTINIDYQYKDAKGKQQINADLLQKDGEHINAKIVQGVEPENPRFHAPWLIDASWENLIRHDVPSIGEIDSDYGKAQVQIRDNKLWANGNAQVNELSIAPVGNYDFNLSKHNNRIDIKELVYDGVVGDLTAQGDILLATKTTPLTWQLDASTKGINPKAYQDNLPVTQLVGNIKGSGRMLDVKRKVGNKLITGQQHFFNITSIDLDAQLYDDNKNDTNAKSSNAKSSNVKSNKNKSRTVAIKGRGDGSIDLLSGELKKFDARFKGNVESQGLPKGNLIIDAEGTSKDITVKALQHKGEAGAIKASGNINLRQGVKWDLKANAEEFNVGFFAPQTQGIVSGALVTSGQWQDNNTTYGDLSAFDIKFDGSLDTPKLPKGKLNIDAGGTSKVINIRKFSHIGDAGQINAEGKVDVSKGINWQIDTVMNNFNVGYFLESVPSTLTGHIKSTGKWQDNIQRIDISEMGLRGKLKGETLTAQGSLDAVLHLPKDMTAYFNKLQKNNSDNQVSQVRSVIEQLNANDLAIVWGTNSLVANGNAQKLQADIDINSLDQLSENLTGNIVGGVTLVQPEGNSLPTAYVDLTAQRIALPSFALNSGAIKGKIINMGKGSSKLALTATGLQVASTNFDSLSALFDGTQAAHTLNLTLANEQVAIKTTLKGALTGEKETLRWQGVMGGGRVSSQYVTLKQRQPTQIIADIGNEPRKTQLQIAAHCWQADKQQGKICLRKNLIASQTKGQVDLIVEGLDTSLIAPLLPNDITWKAKIDGKALVGWKQGEKPSINTTLYSDNGRIGLIQDSTSGNVSLPYKRISIIAASVADGLKLRTDIDAGRGGKGVADIKIDPYAERKTISGDLNLNELDIAIFKPFFPELRTLEGQATMVGELGGTLKTPIFEGKVDIKDAQVAMLKLPLNLSDINATATVQGTSAIINGSFMSGEGNGTVSGSINWQQKLQAKLSVKGQRLVVTEPPFLFAEINPDIDIILRPSDRYINIEGIVVVPSATIRPPEANAEVIIQSSDVVVLDRRLIGNLDEVLAITEPWSINADIGIDLGSDVSFRGFGAVLPLAGAINVTQKGQGVMKAVGMVQVSRRSNIDAFGQNLELNYGQVRFNGDILNPRLSIEAVKEIEGQTVGLRVTGNSSDPNITVFNDAGLTQQQAMNALVTGRIANSGATQISEEGFKSEVTNNLAAAGLSLGLSGTRSLTNSIGKAFGLQRLTLDASGSDNDANVNVTGYITPDLYIRYGVGVFNAETSLSLRYQLTRRIYVEATSATENAVDVVYSWQF